jgi:hypothetical protein
MIHHEDIVASARVEGLHKIAADETRSTRHNDAFRHDPVSFTTGICFPQN